MTRVSPPKQNAITKKFHLFISDLIDPIIEEVLPTDYLVEEDPLLYKSKKTNRGPMPSNWLDLYQSDNPPSSVMCAYKLIKVEFKYWGMQVNYSKIIL